MAITAQEAYSTDVDTQDLDLSPETAERPRLRIVGGRAYDSARVYDEIEPSQTEEHTRWDHKYGPAEQKMREMMKNGLI